MKGIVKWYDNKKGYGFIKGDDGNSVFAHRSDLSYFEVYLKKGDLTEYKVVKTKSGDKAIDIIIKNRLNNREIKNLLIPVYR
jgi:CspA family cold shock protein